MRDDTGNTSPFEATRLVYHVNCMFPYRSFRNVAQESAFKYFKYMFYTASPYLVSLEWKQHFFTNRFNLDLLMCVLQLQA